ncbi:hypothetical protein Lbru_0417 [Legionella brunensis]|uniref:Uncharacterized protein n=1 Tax=Legionella brunensis TaxID=29422 RepID=A0A0W0ST89_9GAMM|nr:hypothetical protein Lbru_0417 [Legionella brunensis]
MRELKANQPLQDIVTILHHQQKTLLGRISQKVTALQLYSVHEILKEWELSGLLVKKKARAIVTGTQGPRKGMIEVQYLQYYLQNSNQDTDDELVFYAEMPPQLLSEATGTMVIEYLSKELCNNLIGEMVFNNKKAMQEDILRCYAPPVIQEIIGEESTTVKIPALSTPQCPYQH